MLIVGGELAILAPERPLGRLHVKLGTATNVADFLGYCSTNDASLILCNESKVVDPVLASNNEKASSTEEQSDLLVVLKSIPLCTGKSSSELQFLELMMECGVHDRPLFTDKSTGSICIGGHSASLEFMLWCKCPNELEQPRTAEACFGDGQRFSLSG